MTLALFVLLAATPKEAPSVKTGPAARIVVWRPHDAAFEEGYRRHLGWHRAHADPWTWHGWTLVSGDRYGSFVDGTFFHAWEDLDHPVSPREDAADNELNVLPHAAVVSATAYELIGELPPASLASPLLTFVWLTVVPGGGSELEARASGGRGALFRPVDGSAEYLLLFAAAKTSELPRHALQPWLSRMKPLVTAVRVETGRYRADLSYLPGTPP